jgi:hypothetical protein
MKHYFYSFCYHDGNTGFGHGVITFKKVTLKNMPEFFEKIRANSNKTNIVVISYQEIK